MKYLFYPLFNFRKFVKFSRKVNLHTYCRTDYRTTVFRRSFCSKNYDFLMKDKKIQTFLNSVHVKVNDDPDDEINGVHSGQLKQLFESRSSIQNSIHSLEEMRSDKSTDEELKLLIEDEKQQYINELLDLEYKLLKILSPRCPNFNGIVLEITAGIGGQEAMLFARDLNTMYCRYFEFKGWKFFTAVMDLSELGGVRHVSMLVEGIDSYNTMKYESGVHRVQRVPSTEKAGRVHTSTVTVAVLPQPKEVDVQINEKEIHIETKRASGAGGQHVNTTDSAVRITHIPTGLAVECQTERSQIRNREIALIRLRSKIYQEKIEQQNSEIRSLRKSQVGTASRSEKVRTYNFNQDRITDHRLTRNFHNLAEFLKGGYALDNVIKNLIFMYEKERLDSFISVIRNRN